MRMGFMEWIKGFGRGASVASVECAATLERIVQLANPRLRFARRYFARLAPAVQNAIEYASALVGSIPPAREAATAAWQSDAYMRAFFATAQDSARVFSRSPEVRAWFGTHAAADEIYVVLSMQLT